MKLILLLLFSSVGAIVASERYVFAKPATVTVLIENMAFNPQEVTVHPGDQIIWKNKDLVPHTVTSDFDSGAIDPEHTWTLHVKSARSRHYKCRFHPTMSGAIVVVNRR